MFRVFCVVDYREHIWSIKNHLDPWKDDLKKRIHLSLEQAFRQCTIEYAESIHLFSES